MGYGRGEIHSGDGCPSQSCEAGRGLERKCLEPLGAIAQVRDFDRTTAETRECKGGDRKAKRVSEQGVSGRGLGGDRISTQQVWTELPVGDPAKEHQCAERGAGAFG